MRPAELEAVHDGALDLAFRRWDRPRLRVGTRMRMLVGLVEVTSVDEVAPGAVSDDDARRAGATSSGELLGRLAAHPQRPVYRVGIRFAGPDPRVALREQAELDEDERSALLERLAHLDRSALADRGPGTRST